MIDLTKGQYATFKAICKKEGIVYETEAEYEKAARDVYSFVELSFDIAMEQRNWERRLEKEPKGFWIEGDGRICYVCHMSARNRIWFDKWGLKCENCQAAFEKKIFPGYILKDRDNEKYITDSQLNWKFNIPCPTIKKLVRDNTLVAREIPNGPMIFLRKENPSLADIVAPYRL